MGKRKSQNYQHNTVEKNKVGEITRTDIKIYSEVTLTEICGVGKRIDIQMNEIKYTAQKQAPQKQSQLTFIKGVKAIQWRKDSFLTNTAGFIECSHEKSNKTLTL